MLTMTKNEPLGVLLDSSFLRLVDVVDVLPEEGLPVFGDGGVWRKQMLLLLVLTADVVSHFFLFFIFL